MKVLKDWDQKLFHFQNKLDLLLEEENFLTDENSHLIGKLLKTQKDYQDQIQSQIFSLTDLNTIQTKSLPKEDAFFYWVQIYAKKIKDIFFSSPEILYHGLWSRLSHKKLYGHYPSHEPLYEDLYKGFEKLLEEKKNMSHRLIKLEEDMFCLSETKEQTIISKANHGAVISPLEILAPWNLVIDYAKNNMN